MGGGTQAWEAHRELGRWVQMKRKSWATAVEMPRKPRI
jgi:hypothetical protein